MKNRDVVFIVGLFAFFLISFILWPRPQEIKKIDLALEFEFCEKVPFWFSSHDYAMHNLEGEKSNTDLKSWKNLGPTESKIILTKGGFPSFRNIGPSGDIYYDFSQAFLPWNVVKLSYKNRLFHEIELDLYDQVVLREKTFNKHYSFLLLNKGDRERYLFFNGNRIAENYLFNSDIYFPVEIRQRIERRHRHQFIIEFRNDQGEKIFVLFQPRKHRFIFGT